MILKTLISMHMCVWLWLELISAGMVQIWESLVYKIEHNIEHLKSPVIIILKWDFPVKP